MAYRARLKETGKRRKASGGRSAKVYVPSKKGPVPVRITAGITDEAETQVIDGDLKEGDSVIIGLALSADGTPKKAGNIFSGMLKRGR
jgi:hypothetical protein